MAGAGPGDPGLIAIRAVEALKQADLVLYDYLVNPALLEYAPPAAERTCLGRHGHGRLMSQDEVHRRMVDAALAGKRVVRLKSGDPAVFARLAEEIAALEAAGVRYEIVPGITAALAAGSYAGIPLTARGAASAVALVAGQEDASKPEDELDYRALAKFPGTLVFYMGVTSAERWASALIAAGKPPEAPAAIVRRCSWPDQQSWCCSLADVPSVIADNRVRPPAIVIVGDVVPVQPYATWFSSLPLLGVRILVARPEHQAGELRTRFEALGAEVTLQPTIVIEPPLDLQKLDDAITNLPAFDWVVFSSANGVRAVFDRMEQLQLDCRIFSKSKLACIGPGTAETLKRAGLRCDLVPSEHVAEGFADALAPHARGANMLVVRASRGREVLAERLAAAGANVTQVVAYESRDVEPAAPEVAQAVREGRIDWVVATSSSIAGSLVRLFGESLRNTRIASIGPATSQTLRELGWPQSAEAADFTLDGIVSAVLEAETNSREPPKRLNC